MSYARVTVRYPDKSSATAEVGHNDTSRPDLLDDLVSPVPRPVPAETIGDDEVAEVETSAEDEA